MQRIRDSELEILNLMREDRTRLEQETANLEEALRRIQTGKKK
jgi:hypothetical protein